MLENNTVRRFFFILLSLFVLVPATGAWAQRISDSSYRTVAHFKSDGTLQDASYRTIGHADGVPLRWAAYIFFFKR